MEVVKKTDAEKAAAVKTAAKAAEKVAARKVTAEAVKKAFAEEATKALRVALHHADTVNKQVIEFEMDNSKDNEWYNEVPTANEIREVIESRKNGKASADIRNEIIKKRKGAIHKNIHASS